MSRKFIVFTQGRKQELVFSIFDTFLYIYVLTDILSCSNTKDCSIVMNILTNPVLEFLILQIIMQKIMMMKSNPTATIIAMWAVESAALSKVSVNSKAT